MTNARSFSQMNYKKGYEDAKAEYESMLNKIRAEIEDIAFDLQDIDSTRRSYMVVDLDDTLEIIDKYKKGDKE